MRKLFLAAAIAAVIIVVALALVGTGISWWLDSQTPEIAADLPHKDPASASRIFNNRIVEKFPVGSNADELAAYLSGQMFEVIELDDLPLDEWQFAELSEHRFVCSRFWKVEWKRDEQDVIQDIRAKYTNACH